MGEETSKENEMKIEIKLPENVNEWMYYLQERFKLPKDMSVIESRIQDVQYATTLVLNRRMTGKQFKKVRLAAEKESCDWIQKLLTKGANQ